MQLVWVPENLGFLMDATVAHIVLTVLAVGVGFILSFPLALAIYRDRRLSGPITAVLSGRSPAMFQSPIIGSI